MAVVGLYAGIGGFELGFQAAGFDTLLLAEKDPYCRQVLAEHFGKVELAADVADVKALPADTSVVTAGFPCQNLSMAGDKVGLHGTKTGDVRHMFDLIGRGSRPTLAIENVYFLLHVARGNAMRQLVESIEELGYRWAYRVVNTLAFGLPQRRRRVFFVASMTLDPRTVLFADEHGAPPASPATLDKPIGFYWTEGRAGVGTTVDGVPPIKVASTVGIPSAPAVLFPDGAVLTPSIDACERLQGFRPGWTNFDYETRRSPRWRMVGNAVSVPAAQWLAGRINEPGEMLDLPSRPLAEGSSWPAAAYGSESGPVGVEASEFPICEPPPSIEAFRDENWRPLSARALRGFIHRAKEGKLRFPKGFLAALEDALRRVE
ncbi:MAG: DNA cytosine methyltransferase [Allosphingosinicella sp.]|uniref:DNA cytosine methyltransferase n=1 Tax=Allosphingosinicella sp. TaxID=2823234 RepID=UPI003960CF70